MVAAEVTDDALSSMEICNSSLGSRTRNTSVSTICWLSRLNEIVEIIAEQVPHERLILRLSRNIQEKALPFTEGQILRGTLGPVVFRGS